MRKILVAIDGLPGSEKAFETAVSLAQERGGQVTALGVLHRPADPEVDRLAEPSRQQARRHLEEVLEAATNYARSRGVLVSSILREGHPAEAIVTCAEEQQAELLVLGSHNGSASRTGLGGTADQVSSHSPCTVMIVK
jgi:nucleotide-binding universal stress UspA family protein